MTLVIPPTTVEFRCVACGYGISMSGALPACPMCQGSDWEPAHTGSATPEPPPQ